MKGHAYSLLAQATFSFSYRSLFMHFHQCVNNKLHLESIQLEQGS